MRCILIFLLFLEIAGLKSLSAQSVPLGNWESHYSYLSARHVLKIGDQIFCSTYNGLFSLNLSDNKIRTFSKSEGLTEVGVSNMAYDASEKLLLLAYRSGNIDLVFLDENNEPKEVIKWSVLNDAQALPAIKKINRIVFRDHLAYLATNFGVVVLDTKRREVKETYRYIGSNGTEINATGITFTADSVYLATAGKLLSASMKETVNRQDFSSWKYLPAPFTVGALTSLNDNIYAGSPGFGIFVRSNGSWTLRYPATSNYFALSVAGENVLATLSNKIVLLDLAKTDRAFESPLFISLQESLQNGSVWVADSKNGLLGNLQNTFRSYSPAEGDTTITVKTDSTVTDQNGLAWTRLPDYLGGGISVKNKQNNQERILSTATGNGGLPSSSINSLAIDSDGLIWFCSDRGVGYFVPDEVLTGARIDAILPIYGQRRLFANEKCTAIAVEPGNRKWIGTKNGLYLFSADGTELVDHFTAADSPLPSDEISALKFEAETGMLFVDSPNGMVSYRSNSTSPAENLSSVTIFPNPVRPGYSGIIGFKGLTSNSVVKITDLSGRLIYETRSQGGTASWNLNNYTGRRARGGIYIVLIVAADGSQKSAGKLAVMD